MMKNRKFELFLLKNRIPGIVISLMMVLMMVLMACHLRLADRLTSKSYRTLSEIAERVADGDSDDADVVITIDRCDYADYDYYVDSECRGRYYFCQEDGMFALLLLDSDEDVLINYSVRGRVLSTGDEYMEILTGLANDMGVDYEQMRTQTYPMIVSEIDFPRIYYNMLLLVLVLVAAWAVYRIAACVCIVLCPWRNQGTKATFGGKIDREAIRDIDEQLRYNVYYDQDGIIITEKYFLYHGFMRTDIVPLANIETYKKLRTTSNIGGNKKIYKLLMTDVEGVTYEQNFKTEAALDEALSMLKGRE